MSAAGAKVTQYTLCEDSMAQEKRLATIFSSFQSLLNRHNELCSNLLELRQGKRKRSTKSEQPTTQPEETAKRKKTSEEPEEDSKEEVEEEEQVFNLFEEEREEKLQDKPTESGAAHSETGEAEEGDEGDDDGEFIDFL